MENGQSKKGRHCPFIGDPLGECFLIDMNSQNIEQAIYYCGGNFEKCEIYKKKVRKQLPHGGSGRPAVGSNADRRIKKEGGDAEHA